MRHIVALTQSGGLKSQNLASRRSPITCTVHMKKNDKAKINNMLVSGNMTPQKMGRKVGKIFYFKKKFCPIFYFMTHLFPTAQQKNRGVEAPRP